jgi:monoamine oxidase
MKRRLFVKNISLSIPATMLLPGLLTSCKKDKLSDTDWAGKIIIIGAGAAGLYAGHLISQYAPNAQLQILEASNQRGGRVRELSGFADFPIELGAEEVHGNKSSWYDIVKNASGVNFVNDNNTTDYYVIDNLLKSEDDLTADTDVIAGNVFVEQASNYNGADQSVKAKADADNLSQRVRPFVNAQTGNEYGTDYSILSIKGITEEDQLWTAGDDNYAVANRSYISIMQETFADAWDKVLLNTQIKKIDYTSSTIVLTDQNNQTYTCDKLIITIPLAVLKDGDVQFLPALPVSKTDAIANIGMGPGMKIILKFNNRFWANDLGSLYGSGNVPEIWYPSLGRGNTQLLTCFVMGNKAATLSALGNGAIQSVLAELDDAFGNNAATSSFVDAHIMDWGKEPFIKGAYSFPIVGGGISKRQALAASLNNNIFFAGEATHTEGHSGTVHGAVESGYRAVEEFIESVD